MSTATLEGVKPAYSTKSNGLHTVAATYAYVTLSEYFVRERTAIEKSEYITGEVRKMAGASRVHNLLATKIVRLLGDSIEEQGGEIYGSDMRVHIPEAGIVTYPDVAIVVGEAPRFSDVQVDTLLNPRVIVEILSPSTSGYDRTDKLGHYRTIETLQEYVLVSQFEARIDVFRRQSETRGDWSLEVAQGLATTAVLSSIGASLSLRQVYSQISFPNPVEDTLDIT